MHNIQSHPLIEPNKILLPPLHIKLRVMKNFVKAMDREGSRFAFLQKFLWISIEKLKAGVFDDPQIRAHDGPNVWWSTEWNWTIRLAITEVSSYKLPGKPPECGIQEENWRGTEEFPPTNTSHTWTIFQRTMGIWVKSRESTTKACRM